jgi:hypothetical protein
LHDAGREPAFFILKTFLRRAKRPAGKRVSLLAQVAVAVFSILSGILSGVRPPWRRAPFALIKRDCD